MRTFEGVSQMAMEAMDDSRGRIVLPVMGGGLTFMFQNESVYPWSPDFELFEQYLQLPFNWKIPFPVLEAPPISIATHGASNMIGYAP